jgi:DNA-binding winged helix-turn-helix (wHTH) protein/tetratricopeptide (TPR) repeat protein
MTQRVPVRFGPFQLDGEGTTLSREGREVPLQPKALELLVLLASHPNQTLTKNQLMARLWPDTFVSESSLTVAVNAVRKALGESAARPHYVRTLARRGYRFALAPSPASEGRTSSSLRAVGRERELALLERWWSDSSGSAHVAFVIGEAGSGKTTLVEEFVARTAASPVPVTRLAGRCLALSGAGAPFLPFLEALRLGLAGPEREGLAAALQRHAPTWCRQFPALARQAPRANEERDRLPIFDRAQLLGELADALLAYGRERPLLCILEDLHWVDPSSADLLAVLCARPAQPGFFLLCTFRVEGLERHNPAFARLQLALRHQARSREMVLGGLTPEHLEQLLAVRFPNNDFAGELALLLHRRTEGHALFATRILEVLLERGDVSQAEGRWVLKRAAGPLPLAVPRSVLDAIRERTDGLSEVERRTLRHASVLGDEFELATLARLSGVEDVLLEARLQRLHAVFGVLVEEPGGPARVDARFRFAHVLFRESSYAELGLRERAALHLRLAHVLAESADPLDAARAAELAVHFERGRDFERAITWLAHAAEQAGRIHSDVEALRHLERGLELLPRLDHEGALAWGAALYMTLGWTQLHLRRGELSQLAFQAAVERARALRALGAAPRAVSAFTTVLEFFEQPYCDVFSGSAVPRLSPDARRLGPACLEAAALQGLWFIERWVSIEQLSLVAEQLLSLSVSLESSALRARALSARAQAEVVEGRLEAALRHLNEALELSPQQADAALWPLLLYTRADVLLLSADFAAAEADSSAALAGSANLGGVTRALMQRGVARGKLGRVTEALADFRQLDQLYERSGRANPYGWHGAWLRRELGDGAGALRLAQAGLCAWREQFPPERWAMAALQLGLEHAAGARSHEAQSSLEEASRAMRAFCGKPLLIELVRAQLESAIALLEERGRPSALACAERWAKLADAHGAREHQVQARLALALLERDAQPARAAATLDTAQLLLEHHPLPFSAYQLFATRAQLAERLGEPGAEAVLVRAQTLVDQIASHIDEAALQSSFADVAEGWLRPASLAPARLRWGA